MAELHSHLPCTHMVHTSTPSSCKRIGRTATSALAGAWRTSASTLENTPFCTRPWGWTTRRDRQRQGTIRCARTHFCWSLAVTKRAGPHIPHQLCHFQSRHFTVSICIEQDSVDIYAIYIDRCEGQPLKQPPLVPPGPALISW